MKICGTVIFFVICKLVSSDTAKEWHENVDWLPLGEALEKSDIQNKPIMLIIHKSWCGACKALKPQFHASKEIGDLSKNFLMVNAGDDDEPHEEMYKPDGGYIPRILFIKDQKIVQELYNEKGNPKFKFYYNTAKLVENSMEKAKKYFQPRFMNHDVNRFSHNPYQPSCYTTRLVDSVLIIDTMKNAVEKFGSDQIREDL